MASVLVQHYDKYNPEWYLSKYYLPDLSFCQHLNKPEGLLVGNDCDGLYIIKHGRHDFSIFSLTTGEIKRLTLPELSTDPYLLNFDIYSIGCKPGSKAYKVLLGYTLDHPKNYWETKRGAILYSLDTNSWKRIVYPFFNPEKDYVYVDSVCYWSGWDGSLDYKPNKLRHAVVSFDFVSESFNVFSAPSVAGKEYRVYNLVDYGGKLGVIGHEHPAVGPSAEDARLWVWDNESWILVVKFSLSHFDKVLALKGHLLLVEVLCNDDSFSTEVHAFSLVTNKWVGSLNLRTPRGLKLLNYAHNPYPLPNFELVANESYLDVEKEKEKEKEKKKTTSKKEKEKEKKKKKKKKTTSENL